MQPASVRIIIYTKRNGKHFCEKVLSHERNSKRPIPVRNRSRRSRLISCREESHTESRAAICTRGTAALHCSCVRQKWKGFRGASANLVDEIRVPQRDPTENRFGQVEKWKNLPWSASVWIYYIPASAANTHKASRPWRFQLETAATGGWRWGARRSYLFCLAWFDPPPLQIMRHLHSTQNPPVYLALPPRRAPPEGALSSAAPEIERRAWLK